MKEKIIVIVGPTAVGKTALSIQLAKTFNGEIISGDSMQVYKKLDIGTAKVTVEEAESIEHHLIDIRDINETYSASDFKYEARLKIQEIIGKGRIPIIVGGTGLYIESLLYNVTHGGKANPDEDFRREMNIIAKEKGKQFVWEMLNQKDPDAAKSIHPNNLVRIIRALEVQHVTGKRFSTYQNERDEKESIYDAYIIGLNTERSVLYDRINKRVDLMMTNGLVEEAKWLYENAAKDSQSTRGIGYAELIDYFNDELLLEQATLNIKQNSRRYAKRQLTWFNNRTPVTSWYDLVQNVDDNARVKNDVSRFIKG